MSSLGRACAGLLEGQLLSRMNANALATISGQTRRGMTAYAGTKTTNTGNTVSETKNKSHGKTTSLLSKSINTSVCQQDLEMGGGYHHLEGFHNRENKSQSELLNVLEWYRDRQAVEQVQIGNEFYSVGGGEALGEARHGTYKGHLSSSVAQKADYFEESRWRKFYNEQIQPNREKLEQQLQLESLASANAATEYTEAWNEACLEGRAGQMGPVSNLILSWNEALANRIGEAQKSISKSKANPGTDKKTAEPFLCILDAEKLSLLTIHAALTWTLQKHRRLLDFQSISTLPCSVRKAKIAEFLGKVVQTEVGIKLTKERIRNKIRKTDEEYEGVKETRSSRKAKKKFERNKELEQYLKNIVGQLKFDKPKRLDSIVRYLSHCNNTFFDGELLPTWDTTIQVKVGSLLIDLLAETAMVSLGNGSSRGEHPAFKLERLGRGKNVHWSGAENVSIKKQAQFLVCSDEMLKVIENHLELFSVLHPKYMPMVVPPMPWAHCYSGGYLTHKTFVMRVRGSKLQREKLKEADSWMGMAEDDAFNSMEAAAALPYSEDLLGEYEYNMEDESGAYEPHLVGDQDWSAASGAVGTSFTVGRKRKGMGEVYDALNSLGVTPWRINKRVFDVVEQVWDGSMDDLRDGTGLPKRVEQKELSRPGERFRMSKSSKHNLTVGTVSESSYEESVRLADNKKILRENRENYSQKCDFLYKFKTANDFIDEDRIYFPHNMDFRGRAYPMHPYLNHLGSDFCRSLLTFADSKPIGDGGLRWMFIHIANLCGANKMSLDAREDYGRNALEGILDSARNPVNGSRWWADAENPYQCLATCFEISDALDSGNPATYSSSIPIHQDGSCNGLQHYAALSRDEEGARSVNLLPCDAPYDVYSRVANLVAEEVEKHANDMFSPFYSEAKNLVGEVDRKLVKQTVMTSVYGVTFVGARQQIASRLKERGWTDKDKIYKTSIVAAKLTMAALDKAFKNAKETMRWLGDCASIISKAGEPVSWTTPLGLPVVQPYRQKNKFVVITTNQRLILQKSNDSDPISSLKQRTAFPPNYVHSIDSTHLLMTASECYSKNITFAGVHDSFWTHASSVDDMNKILREKFISLHEQPLLEDLLKEFQHDNPGLSFPPVPELGCLELKDVREAKYFFS
ncbi:DNA-dependent RNA polymerase [Chloropicon primus]|nr:DNA-dependent RNA polymerase [Chloropicon primus]